MARIRSIHPGIFTDEAFMSASAHARLLVIGIWCEAWDDGIFEWKPITLKAKIFPADNVEISDLLAELERLNCVKKFSANGKPLGAIRNFCKWQRPKKPNSSGFMDDELRTYVHLSTSSSEPILDQFGTGSEKADQREDGGGRREDEGGKGKKEKEAAAASLEAFSKEEIERRCEQAAGFGTLSGIGKIAKLIEGGIDLDERILPIIREMSKYLRDKCTAPKSWLYFVPAIEDPDRKVAAPPASVALVQSGYYAAAGSKQLDAWQEHTRATSGKSSPTDSRGGWRFPTEWPPMQIVRTA